ncbi:uncharacterized protein BDFB_007977, partial [Asbolus verrucosus]
MMSKITTHDTFGKQDKILYSQAREIIANVLIFMKNEAEDFHENNVTSIPIANYKQRVMAAIRISEKMYKTIVKEEKDVNTGASTSFLSQESSVHVKKHQLVEGEKHAVRAIIHEFHIMKKWRKTEDNRQILMESYDIRLKRITYLKQLFKYRTESRPVYYTDESYIHTS